MSETEEPVAAAPAAEEPTENGTKEPAKTAADWKKVPKPDEQALKDNISAIETEIEEFQGRIVRASPVPSLCTPGRPL